MYYPQQMPFYKMVPVSCEAEINNHTLDFNGAPAYFYNQATNEIIVRHFDILTGVTSTQKFIRETQPKEEKKDSEFEERFNSIDERLSGLEKLLQKGGKNDK